MASEIIHKMKKQMLVLILIMFAMGICITISVTCNVKQHKQITKILETYDADIPRADVTAINRKRRKGKK